MAQDFFRQGGVGAEIFWVAVGVVVVIVLVFVVVVLVVGRRLFSFRFVREFLVTNYSIHKLPNCALLHMVGMVSMVSYMLLSMVDMVSMVSYGGHAEWWSS